MKQSYSSLFVVALLAQLGAFACSSDPRPAAAQSEEPGSVGLALVLASGDAVK